MPDLQIILIPYINRKPVQPKCGLGVMGRSVSTRGRLAIGMPIGSYCQPLKRRCAGRARLSPVSWRGGGRRPYKEA